MLACIEGELSRVHGDDDTADAAYGAAIELARVIGDHRREAVCLGNRVYIATRRAPVDKALGLARSAVGIHQRHGYRNLLPRVALALSGALAQQGHVEHAAVLVASATRPPSGWAFASTRGMLPTTSASGR